MSHVKIIDAIVADVRDNYYVLQTPECTYKLPVGTVQIENGKLIPLDDDTYLKLIVDDANTPEVDDVNLPEISDVNTPEEDYINTHPTSDERNIADWTEQPTKLLIQLYGDKKNLVENRKIKSLKKMWEIISNLINENGYSYTCQQCESKWKSLERAYKNKILNSKKTGRGRKYCPYERELSEILAKKSSIFPPLVLDAVSETRNTDAMIQSGIEIPATVVSPVPSCSFHVPDVPDTASSTHAVPSATPKKKKLVKSEIGRLIEIMEQRNADRKMYEDKKLELMQKKMKFWKNY